MVILMLIILVIVIGSSVVYEDNFAVVTGTINLTNGAGSTTLNYPSGFDANNCIAIATGIDIRATNYYSYNSDSTMIFSTRLTQSNVQVVVHNQDSVGSSSTKNVRVVLMKI